ncbi:unnamed protein product [Dovyalis caffra]|uniref:Transmembrane protein n=1 Tax=Dovyalis caffra TaxID=77055 RepID=A0AAV1QMV9_9ROSI|nr:unnamed protein product [Dovyalis caffra]
MTSGGSVAQREKTGIPPIPPFAVSVSVPVPEENNKPATRSVSKLKLQPPKKILGKRKHNLLRSSHRRTNTYSQICNAGLRMVLEEDDRDRDRDIIIDSSLSNNNHHLYDDFSIFPPSNHENLKIHLNDDHPAPPSSNLSPLQSQSSHLNPPPSPSSVSQLPRWWIFTLQILRSKMASIGSYFGCIDGKGRAFWSSGNVGLAVMVVVWWLCVRVRRHWRRKQTVGRLLQFIGEKDKKIIQLLNQIAQMNEVLLTYHKVMASKLADQ